MHNARIFHKRANTTPQTNISQYCGVFLRMRQTTERYDLQDDVRVTPHFLPQASGSLNSFPFGSRGVHPPQSAELRCGVGGYPRLPSSSPLRHRSGETRDGGLFSQTPVWREASGPSRASLAQCPLPARDCETEIAFRSEATRCFFLQKFRLKRFLFF